MGVSQPDGRIQGITNLQSELDALGQQANRLTRDPARVIAGLLNHPGRHSGLRIGVIVHSIPGLNWYKVQLGDSGWVAAYHLSDSIKTPLGPRSGAPLTAGSTVIIFCPTESGSGPSAILGVVPHALEDDGVACPGWISQGSQAGYKRERIHKQVAKGMERSGGIQDFSCQSPVDSTSLEWNKITETGVGIHIDSFMAFLRVNEMCGLSLSFWDGLCSLAGSQLEITSAIHDEQAYADEGEANYQHMVATYPWEALGLYAPGTDFTQEYSDEDVQYNKPVGKVDLPDTGKDVQPIHRVRHYGGYLGQGGLDYVVKLQRDSGVQRYSDPVADEGVFAQHVGLDGSYVVQSAKSMIFAKRCLIPVPKQQKLVNDATGDDAEAGNYKFSSQFGSGEDHKVNDMKVTGTNRSIRRVGGVQDILAWNINWKRLHPFHYHKKDYQVAEESQSQFFSRTMDNLDFGVLSSQSYMSDPTPKVLRIDKRYNDVEYFQREAFIAFLDDGGIAIADGFGSQITMTAGNVRIEAPGSVQILPGRTALIMSGEVIVKSHDSVDISSSNKDVRLRAFKNLQILGENTVLVESKSTSKTQDYQDKIGEDVDAGGIVLKSASVVGLLGEDVYIRSGAKKQTGDIVLDAGKGLGTVAVNAKKVDAYVKNDFTIWHYSGSISGTTAPSMVKSHRFGQNNVTHEGSMVLAKGLIVGSCGSGNLAVNGSIAAVKGVASGGQYIAKKEGLVGPGGDQAATAVTELCQDACQALQKVTKDGQLAMTGDVTVPWYGTQSLGSDDTISAIGFSYRDSDEPGKQYHTTTLQFVESRWHQIQRLGGGSGGDTWEEKPVSYQGRQLYPWPGKAKWEDSSVFLRLAQLGLYDWGRGVDKERSSNQSQYESPTLPENETASLAQNFKIVKPN